MGEVIRLSGPSFRPSYIEMDGGIVTKSTDPDVIGKRLFFVNLVEVDGSHIGLWEGYHLGDAIREAHAARREFGIEAPVRDLFGGAR